MMLPFRRLAWAVALVAGTGTALAQTTVIETPPQTQTQVLVTEPLALSPDQRTVIYRTIRQERVLPAQPTVQYRVGMRVPETVTLYDVPRSLVTEVPGVRTYKYMLVNNRVWLVDPATSEIVAEVAE